MSARADTDHARVVSNLYGALLAARPYVARRLDAVREHGTDRLYAVVAETLDRVDGALADAADHLESDGNHD